MKKGYVYILTNKTHTVLYVGVTSNLKSRILQHKHGFYKGFTSKYQTNNLVYFEEYSTIKEAILREKQLKGGNRKQKIDLIDDFNPGWKDIYQES